MTQKITAFFNVSPDSTQLIEQHTQYVTLAKDKVAIHKGDRISGAYIVTQGSLRVFSYLPNGTESTFYRIQPGETCVFAINSLFNRMLYPAWVAAESETELAVIDGNAYKTLFSTEPEFQNLTILALSTAVQRLMLEVEQRQGWKLNQRLANHLLNSASATGLVTTTQQQVADHLGSTREVVARLLGEFNHNRWIKTQRGKIQLLETEALATLLID